MKSAACWSSGGWPATTACSTISPADATATIAAAIEKPGVRAAYVSARMMSGRPTGGASVVASYEPGGAHRHEDDERARRHGGRPRVGRDRSRDGLQATARHDAAKARPVTTRALP